MCVCAYNTPEKYAEVIKGDLRLPASERLLDISSSYEKESCIRRIGHLGSLAGRILYIILIFVPRIFIYIDRYMGSYSSTFQHFERGE